MTTKLNTNDIIDARDIIERYEELVIMTSDVVPGDAHEALASERDAFENLLADLRGNGGDEEWRGDWYPMTLVRGSYFQTYAQELAEECGMIDETAQWPMTCIDWPQAARELQHDYLSCEIDGVAYWYR